jgi:transposase InsO family protein
VDDDLRERIGVFRYSVIRDLVGAPLAPGAKERLLGELASRTWTIPGTTRSRVGRSTIRDWVDLYQAMGLDGLIPRPRRDQGLSHALPDAIQDLLLALRRERPRASVESLVRAARLSGAVPAVVALAPSTVHRLFAAHGLGRNARPPSPTEPDARAFTYPHANDLWTSDILHGPRLVVPGRTQGPKTYLYAFLDDATRAVPFAAFYLAENAACFQDALKQALLRRAMPRRLYCDNGATFRTHHLEVICATLNVALIHSRPYRPRGRGKVERFFRSVRTAFLPHVTDAHLESLASLNRVWWAWLEGEYHQTPHRGLEGKTPLDRFLEDEALLRPAPEDLDRLMRMKVLRKVARDRTLRLAGRFFEAPDGFAGETIEVLYDPYDPIRPVHMRRRGETQELLLRRLDLAMNAETRRVSVDPDPTPPAAPTGIRYLDLIARRFYEGEV